MTEAISGLVVLMARNGLMMYGHMIHGNWLGNNSIALDTYLFLGKATQPPWLATFCTYMEVGRRRGQIWVISQRLGSHQDAGTHSKTWDRHLRLVLVTA